MRSTSGAWWRCWHGLQRYLLSAHLQLGAQLAAGIVLCSLHVFVSALRFRRACFASVLMCIGLVSMSPEGHVGTKLLAAAHLLGQAWLGAVTAGLMVTIARPAAAVSHGAYLSALCVTTCLGLGLLTSARAGPSPITLWPNITIACLDCAVVVLWASSQDSTAPLSKVWRDDVGGMFLCGITAALAVTLVAVLVLPTLATEEVVRLASAAVRGVGHSLSRYLSLLLDTSWQQHSPHTQQVTAAPAGADDSTAPGDTQGQSSRPSSCQSPTALAEAGSSSGSSSAVADVSQLPPLASRQTAAAVLGKLQPERSGSSVVVFAPAHDPVQLVPLALARQQQPHHHWHRQQQGVQTDQQPLARQQQHQQQHPQQQQRGLHALHLHERHHHPHASVLPTPHGPVAVLGPSVDELRHLLMRARTALARGAYEPHCCDSSACGGRGLWSPAAATDVAVWRELLAAAEQLVSVVSTLQDVLVHASPRLLHPATAITSSLASFSATASAVIGLTINSTAQLAQVLMMPQAAPQLLAHRALLATSWSAARLQLEDSRASAVQGYWRSISRHSGKLVASSSEALAVMFVWVAVGAVMTAVERLDVAGSRLISASSSSSSRSAQQAQHDAGSAAELQRSSLIFNRQSSFLGLEARHTQRQHLDRLQLPFRHNNHQQQQHQHQQAAAAHGQRQLTQVARAMLSAVLLLPVVTNIALFWWGHLQALVAGAAGLCGRGSAHGTCSKGDASRSWLHRLRHNRGAAAALKLWLGMSGFVVLVLLIADNAAGHIHPTVAYAVATVPTHGVIALVLAWHERVESTLIRVLLRIAGTAAGGTVGWAALQATTNPVLLVLIMCAVGMLLAPLASASFHFRLATALTIISMLVVVLCQFDTESGESRATDLFYGTRLIEVTVACLWAAAFNQGLLPWSSKDWSLEQVSTALQAAADVLSSTCQLQFQAAQAATAGAAGLSSNGGSSELLAESLVQQECVLQKQVIEPVAAVQTALTMETHVWFQCAAPRTISPALKTLVRDTLQLADRITAVQIAVAALPRHAAGSSSAGGRQTPDSSQAQQQQQQQQQHQLEGDASSTAAVEQSVRYVITVLTQPLHKCHEQQLQLVGAVAPAVKAVLLEPSAAAHQHLQGLIGQLEAERDSSSSLIARLRKQLHRDVIAAPALHQAGLSDTSSSGADAGVSGSSSSSSPSELADGVSRWWWQHAGEHYCQLLAFEYAFGAAIAGVLAVARTALAV